MRWMLRFVAVICLSVAVVAAVFDAALCVSAGRFVFTPLGNMLVSLGMSKAAVWTPVAPSADSLLVWWDHISIILLRSPVWLLFGTVALLFFIAGHQRRA